MRPGLGSGYANGSLVGGTGGIRSRKPYYQVSGSTMVWNLGGVFTNSLNGCQHSTTLALLNKHLAILPQSSQLYLLSVPSLPQYKLSTSQVQLCSVPVPISSFHQLTLTSLKDRAVQAKHHRLLLQHEARMHAVAFQEAQKRVGGPHGAQNRAVEGCCC